MDHSVRLILIHHPSSETSVSLPLLATHWHLLVCFCRSQCLSPSVYPISTSHGTILTYHSNKRGETVIGGLSMHLLGYIFNRIFTEINNRGVRYFGVVWTQTFGTFSHPLNIAWMSLACTDSEERALAMAMSVSFLEFMDLTNVAAGSSWVLTSRGSTAHRYSEKMTSHVTAEAFLSISQSSLSVYLWQFSDILMIYAVVVGMVGSWWSKLQARRTIRTMMISSRPDKATLSRLQFLLVVI